MGNLRPWRRWKVLTLEQFDSFRQILFSHTNNKAAFAKVLLLRLDIIPQHRCDHFIGLTLIQALKQI